jgi:hypothetical protein
MDLDHGQFARAARRRPGGRRAMQLPMPRLSA